MSRVRSRSERSVLDITLCDKKRLKIPQSESVYRRRPVNTKFVSDFRQVGGFLRVLRFPPPIKLTDINEIMVIESGAKHADPNP